MAACLIALWALSLAWDAESTPTLSFPFNAQLPPVARIDQFFSFSPSPHTFQSSSSIIYSLDNHPAWLSIDRDSGRLYGTPEDDDVPAGEVVGQTIGLVATDKTGSTSTNATLVVSRDKGPSVEIPLARQIKSFGPYSAPSSLLLYPSTEFEYIFDSETFSTPHILNYYATSNDSSPLPSWVHFDAGRLRFSGKTPAFKSLIQPPQTFDISLVASDIIGFSGAWVSFSLVVGSHQLTTDNPLITLNVTKGSELSYSRLDSGIKLDNKKVAPGDLSVSIEDMPPWLSYNVDEGRLQGTPKDGDHSTNFTINFRDSLQDTLSVMVVVNVNTGLFQTTFEDVQARPGDVFYLDLSPYFRDPADITLEIESASGEDWLTADGLEIGGRVPETAKGDLSLTINASSRSTGHKEKETLHLVFLAADGTVVSATPSSAPSYQPTGIIGPALNASEDHGSTRRRIRTVLLATLIPLFLLSLLGLLFILLKRRRRQVDEVASEKRRMFKLGPTLMGLHAVRAKMALHLQVGKTTIVQRVRTGFLKRRHGVDAEMEGQTTTTTTTRPDALETMSILEAPPAISSYRGRWGTVTRTRTPNSDRSRDSWVTVQGTMTPSRSERTMPREMTAMAHGAEHTADGASFRSAVDASTASMNGLARVQSIIPVVSRAKGDRNSVDRQTFTTITTTTSSSPFPASQWRNHRLFNIPGKWPLYPAPLRVSREPAPISEEDDGQQSDRQPRLSCPVLFRPSQEPSTDRHSIVTTSSFASTENWRMMAWPDTLKRTVDRLLPSRASGRSGHHLDGTEAASASGTLSRQTPELLSPSRWGEEYHGKAATTTTTGEMATEQEKSRSPLQTPPMSGYEFDYDAEFMSDGRGGAMRTIRTVLGEDEAKRQPGGDAANFI